ncbi:hypothetical protein H2202_001189 [Exophiala xenobiotica]|nr:hypothetical protein H2202_001189 [Exophiala xenobiotica]
MHTSTDSASTPSPTSTVTAADIPHAVVLYPTGQPTINNIDTVVVAYDTVWTSANLTLFCGIDAAANEWALAEIKLGRRYMYYLADTSRDGDTSVSSILWDAMVQCDECIRLNDRRWLHDDQYNGGGLHLRHDRDNGDEQFHDQFVNVHDYGKLDGKLDWELDWKHR